MRFLLPVLAVSFLAVQPAAVAQSYQVFSPDSILSVTVALDGSGVPRYQVQRFGLDVVRPSRLGFRLKNAAPLLDGFAVAADKRTSFDETWTQPWGEKKDIRNHYNELRLTLQQQDAAARRMDVVFRVFDDGVGFRYEIPEQPGLGAFEIMDEATEFALVGDPTAWWIPALKAERYEYLYRETPLSKADTVHTPLTLRTEDGLYLSFHEAALVDYASMTLARVDSSRLKAYLVPWSDGTAVKTAAPMHTPWRTLQIADTPGELITSYLILNLNEPNKLGDVSWVKPGKYVGIWWEMHLDKSTWGSGPRHGATTANTRRYIDFAAANGFDGVLVEGWNEGWDGNWIQDGAFSFTRPYPDFDLEGLADYARQKGVALIGHHETGGNVRNYEPQMEAAYALYEKLGVSGVKTGYVNYGIGITGTGEDGAPTKQWHHGQYMVRHYQATLEGMARHHLMLDIHEPIKDTGLRRTWPNMMTREGARGQEYNAWSGDGGNPPDHTTLLPFTRMLSGPMDFTPGIFDLLFEDARPNNRVNTTLAKQLALYVVLYSPLQMAADLPENYEARPDAFQFIKDVPADWEDTRVLHADIGNYVTIARQKRDSDEWFLGSITDENGRMLRAPLTFLPDGRPYVAEIYRDGAGGDWKTNPYALDITRALVTSRTVLPLRLAPGGGTAIRFRPATSDEEKTLPRLGE